MLDAFEVQLTTVLSLLAGNLLFGVLPFLSTKAVQRYYGDIKRLQWATFMMFFGAGVFLSDSFLVLLPQANKDFRDRNAHVTEGSEEHSDHHHDAFPITEFIVLAGFFGAYVSQELIHFVASKCNLSAKKSSDLRVIYCSCAKRHTECSRTYKDARPDQTYFDIDNRLVESCKMCNAATAVTNGPSELAIPPKPDLLRSSIIAQTMPNYGTLTNIAEPATDSPLPILTPPVLLTEERRIEVEQQTAIDNEHKLIVGSFLTALAHALQYIFLGIALGLHLTTKVKWGHALTSCLQNFVLIFSASTILTVDNLDTTYVALHTALLSIISPVGVIIAITNTVEEVSLVAKGTVTAVACGALMYTTFYEILRHKRDGSVAGFTKFGAIIVGACLMAGIQYATTTI